MQSPRWNQASWPAQSLFTRLITLVDDYARFDAHPLLLARVAFPYGDPKGRRIPPEQVAEWLHELKRLDMIELYTVNGSPFLEVKRWTERNRMKNPSRFPPRAGTCQQMPPDAVSGSQEQANAALSSSTSAASTNATEGKKNGAVAASRTQFAALRSQISELEKRRSELSPEERQELRKKTRELSELQKKQAKGIFE